MTDECGARGGKDLWIDQSGGIGVPVIANFYFESPGKLDSGVAKIVANIEYRPAIFSPHRGVVMTGKPNRCGARDRADG
jgi:hypothetical protein